MSLSTTSFPDLGASVATMLSTTTNMGLNENDTGNATEIPPYCIFEEPPLMFVRFLLVTVIGSLVSCVSIVENLFIFFVFATRKCHRTSYNVYLMLLAFFDFFVSLAYVMLMSVNVLTDFLHSVSLLRLWMSYMIPMITVSHIAITSSSFLIVAATLERYCITTNSKYLSLVQKNRKWIAFIAVCFGIISKGTMPLEFIITTIEECAGLMTELGLGMRDFVFETPYHVVWRLWYRNIVTVFFPFFVLAFFNIKIVAALRYQPKESFVSAKNGRAEMSAKNRTTNATRTMICVVSCYLVSNIINVSVTFLEHFDKKLIENHQNEYAISLDVVSLATNVSCLLRVPIYMICQPVLRREILFTLKHWIHCRHARRSGLDRSDMNLITTASPENGYLTNGQFERESSFNGDVKKNGHFANGSNLKLTQTKNNHGALIFSYDEDQQSTSSSITAQHDLLNKLIRGSNNETLL